MLFNTNAPYSSVIQHECSLGTPHRSEVETNVHENRLCQLVSFVFFSPHCRGHCQYASTVAGKLAFGITTKNGQMSCMTGHTQLDLEGSDHPNGEGCIPYKQAEKLQFICSLIWYFSLVDPRTGEIRNSTAHPHNCHRVPTVFPPYTPHRTLCEASCISLSASLLVPLVESLTYEVLILIHIGYVSGSSPESVTPSQSYYKPQSHEVWPLTLEQKRTPRTTSRMAINHPLPI